MDEEQVALRCATAMFENDAASRQFGFKVTVEEAGHATVEVRVSESMLNGFEVCHGGIIFALADTAFAFACNGRNQVTLAAGASIDFLRSAKIGDTLTAVAGERHRGRRSGVYDVQVTNQDGEAVALFRGRSHATNKLILGKSDTEMLEKTKKA